MAKERILLTKDMLRHALNDERHLSHVGRYGAVRRFCYGNVVDVSCGCGYGTHMLSLNPDVRQIIGVDNDLETIQFARKHYRDGGKVQFVHADAGRFFDRAIKSNNIDTAVCLETLEHLTYPDELIDRMKAVCVDQVIISYPDKHSTSYNPHHQWDFVDQDIVDFFLPDYILFRKWRMQDVSVHIYLRQPAMPGRIKRYFAQL